MLLIWVTGAGWDNTKTGIVERTIGLREDEGFDLNFSRVRGVMGFPRGKDLRGRVAFQLSSVLARPLTGPAQQDC